MPAPYVSASHAHTPTTTMTATHKLPEEGHPRPWPDDIVMSPEVVARVSEQWGEIMGV